ncbi:hypothetical protein EZJ49_08365 [Bdellovibrio bacteriovorus]|uniref:hypothetical protein n=1 Tax=Bdellovibrio bacteriovorus TaxID=959 RepID=UPI0021D2130D|nr:hypothetical protein [Bdellovibrio bacteriovorus]UXR63088.1 hypothetical protein EZJ49_08365 [Bdellovibrio bacteriovorus]
MKKTVKKNTLTQKYLKNISTLFALPVAKKYNSLTLEEYPFDAQLLNASSLYRQSRNLYLSLDGKYAARVCSTMRSLSAQDLFKDHIEYSPILSEMLWFKDHAAEVADPEASVQSLLAYSEISLFHEQNHRILWRLLPPAPKEQRAFCRYLNFAESLVVTLDLALGDELGTTVSNSFEQVRAIYRPGGVDKWSQLPKKEYRQYLYALLTATYLLLEMVHPEDIESAVNYIVPGNKPMVKAATKRALELSELFTHNTNQQWQQRFWKQAQTGLSKLHNGSKSQIWHLPEDPLDLNDEFLLADRVFEIFGL